MQKTCSVNKACVVLCCVACRHRMVAQREGREQLEARELKEAEKRRKANAGEEGYRSVSGHHQQQLHVIHGLVQH